MKRPVLTLIAFVASVAAASAHDIWIEPSSALVRTGDWVRLSLMLGNHGNGHRDFRLASKVPAGDQNLSVYGPKMSGLDLTPNLVDTGYTPQEGFWSGRFQPSAPGLYMAVSTFDKAMSYAPVRDVKCAKTYFVVSDNLDRVPESNPGYDKVLGQPLELVPLSNPVTPFGPGSALRVRLLFKGKPLAGARVSFIPRGTQLQGDQDPQYERTTDAKGEAALELREADLYLIAAHKEDANAAGPGYRSISYSATICLLVPGVCPCCAKG